ncbi:type VI secretion system protein ImpK [Cognatiyoonia koreensis]|uniref:Type VI secretion system protein ImpK n=1 Tax=Cognatiyoonia koreensis TaxID=364200 RepID=A0A1I0RIR9_9RHOB|nr:type IVB secretion system protein IcmH/DotU [Cognatiyoonia koreensis]SEW40159.1 type VI secretion system protein ImpK [Cognatiyoonia koreensis]
MSDDDKTVFGGKLPGVKPPAQDNDRTVIGGALPPVQPGGFGRPAQPSTGNTWLGGPVQQPAPAPQSPIGRPAGGQQEGFFPQIPQESQPQAAPMSGPKISLNEALRAKGLGKGGPSNPLLAAAANLLILFGRLRTGMVEMQAVPLMEHVTREIDQFERNAVQAGADPHEAQVGKYALCGTADDIVQNLPGADKGVWIQYSMVARFFQKRDSGVGFFQEAEKAMQAPGQRFNLLELMLVCLSLGFEGQYRTLPNGSVELARIRSAIYETLRRVHPRPDEDISVSWTAVPLAGKRKFGGLPLWIFASIAAVLVVATFAGLSTLIARDGGQVVSNFNTMHPNASRISLVRPVVVEQFTAPVDTTQLDRISGKLSEQIANGSVEVGEKGNYIFVRVGNALLFGTGSAEVKPEFEALAGEIAAVLDSEPGPILVQGFTDNIPMSGRGRYKSNQELSDARATSVANKLLEYMSDAERVTIEGRGEASPIGDNSTPEGRAQNRRVEVLLAREGTY